MPTPDVNQEWANLANAPVSNPAGSAFTHGGMINTGNAPAFAQTAMPKGWSMPGYESNQGGYDLYQGWLANLKAHPDWATTHAAQVPIGGGKWGAPGTPWQGPGPAPVMGTPSVNSFQWDYSNPANIHTVGPASPSTAPITNPSAIPTTPPTTTPTDPFSSWLSQQNVFPYTQSTLGMSGWNPASGYNPAAVGYNPSAMPNYTMDPYP